MKRKSILLLLIILGLSEILYAAVFPVDQKQFTNLPIYFVKNQGQLDSQVAFYVPGKENTVYFENHGLTFVLHPKSKSKDRSLKRIAYEPSSKTATNGWVVKLDFVDPNINSRLEGQNVTAAVFNYFHGSKQDWKTAVKTFASLKYSNVWPGIDLVYAGTANQIKYNFIVKPGVDPNQIQLRYRGASNVTIRENGELEISTPLASFHDGVPSAYQNIDGIERQVPVKYSLDKKSEDGSYSYSFQIGSYDKRQPLILDPVIFFYSGFLGGAGNDEALGVAVDLKGNAYVVGSTNSDETTFPVLVGPKLAYAGGLSDGFIAKIKPNATLENVGYIGGPGEEAIRDVTVDVDGNAYVTGITNSTTTFPLLIGPDLTYNGGFHDAFITKIDVSGGYLHFSGYIGGSQVDQAFGIAIDQYRNSYVTGQTNSDQNSFPVYVGPDLTFNGAFTDAFVCKISEDGSTFRYCGYIGGANEDTAGDIGVDSNGYAVISGTTESDQSTFPIRGYLDNTHNGNTDAFVARIVPSGVRLAYAGFIGGSDQDAAGTMGFNGGDYTTGGIAVSENGTAFVTGFTMSDESTFPVKVGPDLTYNGGRRCICS